MVRMWDWSRNWECGRVSGGAADVGVAVAGDEHGAEFRVLGALVLFLPP